MSLFSDRLDGIQAGVAIKAPCRVATTGPITLYGEQTIDGEAVSANGNGIAPDRACVKDQPDPTQNGIYDVSATAWSRAKDFDGARDVVQGTLIPVYTGTVNGRTTWQCTTANPIRPGTSSLTFEVVVDVDLASDLANTASTGLGDALIGVKRTITGAITTNLHNYLDGSELNLKRDFGAVGDGTTDDTTAVQNALNAGEFVFVPVDTYRITHVTGVANAHLCSPGATFKLASSSTVSNYMFYASGVDNITLDGITWDWNNAAWGGAGLPVNVGTIECDNYKFINGGCINFRVFGLSVSSSRDILIDNNYFEIITAVNSINKAVTIQSSSSTCTRVHIINNRMVNTGLALDASYVWVRRNQITGFKYGGGISAEQSVNSKYNFITGNIIQNGTGTDTDLTLQSGMEIWAPYSVIAENFISGNAGAGIDNGGAYTTVCGNICLNNCTAGGTNTAGITSRYGDATYNASGSRYYGNVSIDLGGGAAVMDYGYADQSASLLNIDVGVNTFYPTKTGQTRILSTTTTFTGRTLQGSKTYDPPSLANGATTNTGVTVPGAAMGERATASFSVSLQGIQMWAQVTATNTVTVYLLNNTGGTLDIASGTLKAYSTQNAESIGY